MNEVAEIAAEVPDDRIDRISWLLIRDYRALFVRTHGGDVFFDPGCRRQEATGNSEYDEAQDVESLIVKMRNDLNIELVGDTVEKLFSFAAPAYGKDKEAEEVMVQIRCYQSDFLGSIQSVNPSRHIAETAWLKSTDLHKTSDAGKAILQHLKSEGIID